MEEIRKVVRNLLSYPRTVGMVSIIVPVYNQEKYIEECIRSLLAQSYNNIEIIIIDDASIDNTVDIIKNINHTNVILVELPRNIGYSGAVTTGLFMAKGEFIAMQDSDDVSHPQRIEKQVNFLLEHPEKELVGTCYSYSIDNHYFEKEISQWLKFGEEIISSYKKGEHCICCGTILFRGHNFDRLGGFNRNLYLVEDYEFLSRYITNNVTVENIPEALYYYRIHSKQRSKDLSLKRGPT
ncbi:glycosyl transferase [Bacillus toyonensis]|nr:glycosyl transferase [Bacillus toyonensis]PEK78550.1 glycosyl transferase [Bacillus toyonensis]PEL21353.1 glycosyl transferase [Bacillus toyonensis]PFY32774.1 glycosyl transferase [Bacillus toyonensis]PFY40183.1 glycosyl transferase [Bacillus toyonensis]